MPTHVLVSPVDHDEVDHGDVEDVGQQRRESHAHENDVYDLGVRKIDVEVRVCVEGLVVLVDFLSRPSDIAGELSVVPTRDHLPELVQEGEE